MAQVIFYEKPGCSGNRRQKRRLLGSGHSLEVRDLLAEAWTPQRLRPFFGALPVLEWFNISAPPVRDGEILPQRLSEAEALALMCANPLLIRRPLMQVADQCRCGFDEAEVAAWIGLAPGTAVADGCDHPAGKPCLPLSALRSPPR
ncbi:ArsC family protein [mine drainage metagenome]|uniref:ArsC family protein n=1 Tax=mine drainage metagenome TaxID=410659 RepID=A0A1J5RS06_9ZZZZ